MCRRAPAWANSLPLVPAVRPCNEWESTYSAGIDISRAVANVVVDHVHDFAFNQSKIMNVIDSNKIERDMQISLRNLRKLDYAGKPVPTFPHPALAHDASK
jgi:hypothetical protein